MHKRRFQRQETMRVENQISPARQNKRGRSDRKWIAGILTVAILVGGVIGTFSLPGDAEIGVHLFTALIGMLVFLFLGGMLIAGIANVRANRQSRQELFWWSLVVITSSILGFFFFPATLFVPIRVFLGACLGYIVSYLLVALVTNPSDFFGQIGRGFVDAGCCLELLGMFIAITGTISSLLIWHSVLLSVLIGGGSALVVVIAFVGLAFASREEEGVHGLEANASVGNPVSGT